MAKKLFGLSMFLWILIALVILFFVYGVGRREGFYQTGCTNANYTKLLGDECVTSDICCNGTCKEKKNRQGRGTGKYTCQN